MNRPTKKELSKLSDDELIDYYAFIVTEYNDCLKCNDDEGIGFYSVWKKLVVKECSLRKLSYVPVGNN